MPKAIIADYKLCTGCRLCEIVCSLKKEGVISTATLKIRVYQLPPELDIPILCVQCLKAPCIDICPQKSVKRDHKTNAIVIQGNCTGCKACINVCPAEAIFIHPESKVAIKCDLCDEKPECVNICQTGALSYLEVPFAIRVFAKKPERIASELCELLALPKEES